MSNVVDNRVVEMRFDNDQFESGVKTSMGTLSRLKEALNFGKSADALQGIAQSFNNVDFSGIQGALYAIQDRFSTFGIIGMTALQNLTNAAINLGRSLISNILSPLNAVPELIKEGGKQRALNVERAKFQLEGLKLNFQDFDKYIDDAVKGTRYGYDEAAMAASQLAASGIKAGEGVGEMGHALLAISGVAAMTNSEYSDMAHIFTTVASNGRLMTEQVRQFSYRGLNITAELAKALGKTEAELNDMISKGKVSFEMFSEAMFKAYASQAKKADETFTGVSANIRAAWKKIGQDFWTPIIENNSAYVKALGKFKNLVNNFIRPATKEAAKGGWTEFVNLLAEGLDGLLSYEPFLKGIDSTIRSITSAIGSLKINDKIKEFYSYLPGLIDKLKAIFLLNDSFRKLEAKSILQRLGLSSEEIEKLASIMERVQTIMNGFQSAVHIFTSFISAVGRGLGTLVKHIFPASDGFLTFGATIAENVTQFDAWLTENDIFNKAIDKIDKYVGPVLDFLVEKFNALAEALRDHLPTFSDVTGVFGQLGEGFKNFFNGVLAIFKNITPYIRDALSWVGSTLSTVGTELGNFFKSLDFTQLAGAAGAGGGIALVITIFKKLSDFFQGIAAFQTGGLGFFGALKELNNTLIAYQDSLNARVIMQIAEAIGILAASIFVLSFIEPEKLSNAVKALGAVMTEFFIFLKAFSDLSDASSKMLQGEGGNLFSKGLNMLINNVTQSITNIGNAAKQIGQGVSLIAIAGAILVLSFAVKKLGELDTKAALQGVIAVGALLKALQLFLKTANMEGMNFSTGMGILLLAGAIDLISIAVEKLGALDITSLFKGVVAVGVLLTFIGLLTRYGRISAVSDYVGLGVGMIAMAVALNILAAAVEKFGSLQPEQLGQGLVGIAAGLVIMVGAFHYLDSTDIFSKVAGLLILAATMHILASAVEKMGSIPIDAMGQGLTGIMVALAGMVIALDLLKGEDVINKAVAILIMSAALDVIAISINKLGAMKPEQMGLALLTLAGAFIVLGAAGYLLGPVVPTIFLLAESMVQFGLGIALVGAGVYLLGKGLVSISIGLVALGAAFAAAGVEIVAGITAIISGIIAGIAASAVVLAEGIVTFLVALGNGATQLIQVVVQLGTAIIQGIIELMPQIVNLILLIISEVLRIVVEAAPQIVLAAAQLMVAFIEGITEKLPEIVNAAFNLIIVFIDSMAAAVNERGPELIASFNNLIGSVVHFLAEAAFQFMWAAIEWIAQLVLGVVDGIDDVVNGFNDLVGQAIDAVTGFWEDFVEAGKNLVEGLISGVAKMAGDFIGAIGQLASDGWNAFVGLFQIGSPSKLMDWGGTMLVKGLARGVSRTAKNAVNAMVEMGEDMYNSFTNVASMINDAINADIDLTPTITPVVDMSSVASGAAALNGMFGVQDLHANLITGAKIDNIDAIASINSKWNPYGDEDVVNSIDKLHNDISDLNTRIEEMNEKDATYEFNLNTQLDGRNIARSTARYNRQELALLDRNTNRKGGKVR